MLARRLLARESREGDVRTLSEDMTLLLELQLDDGTDSTNLHRWGRGGYHWGLPREALAKGELDSADCLFQPNG